MHDSTLGPASGERPEKDRMIREVLEDLWRLDREHRAGRRDPSLFCYPEGQERFVGGPLEGPDPSGPIAGPDPSPRGSRGAPDQLGEPKADSGP